jgi:hypothetical protein
MAQGNCASPASTPDPETRIGRRRLCSRPGSRTRTDFGWCAFSPDRLGLAPASTQSPASTPMTRPACTTTTTAATTPLPAATSALTPSGDPRAKPSRRKRRGCQILEAGGAGYGGAVEGGGSQYCPVQGRGSGHPDHPVPGDPELTPRQNDVVQSNLPAIRKAIGKYMRWYRQQNK